MEEDLHSLLTGQAGNFLGPPVFKVVVQNDANKQNIWLSGQLLVVIVSSEINKNRYHSNDHLWTPFFDIQATSVYYS